jgi:uncharacterized protein (TIGR00730 family)
MQNILIYCGSSTGNKPIYKQTAVDVAKYMAAHQMTLVYGAGSVGLMGVLADTILAEGGRAVGSIPSFLEKWEVGHKNLSEIYVVETMHERKALMAQKADAVLALPGGYGTLDELFEILTWRQLQLHDMPIGLLNINGYFDSLLAMIDNMVNEGFLKDENRQLLLVDSTIEGIFEKLANHEPAIAAQKWVERG